MAVITLNIALLLVRHRLMPDWPAHESRAGHDACNSEGERSAFDLRSLSY